MNNKKVVITGNQGFIGVWTTALFLSLGWKVYGIDNRSSSGDRLFDNVNLQDSLEMQSDIDISSVVDVEAFLQECQPSLIINLAGQAIVPRAFREPFATFMSNTVGTLSVLDAANRVNSVKAIAFITSDKVYENKNDLKPFSESDELGGKDIYSLSKSCCERICSTYLNSGLLRHDLNIQTIRLGNVVGGGDWSINRLVPDIIKSIVTQEKFKVRYINATRPFQYILDVVEGIANISISALASKLKNGEAWNLGPKNNTHASVNDVLNCFDEQWSECKLDIETDGELYKEDMNLRVDVSKYSNTFSPPKFDSNASIVKTIEWYKKYYNKSNSKDFMMEEVKGIEVKNENI
jgi:CDP-glucose 4,6-dehydratase